MSFDLVADGTHGVVILPGGVVEFPVEITGFFPDSRGKRHRHPW